MHSRYKIFFLLILCTVLGCAFGGVKNNSKAKIHSDMSEGQIFAPSVIKKGGTLVVIPFRAGADVPATLETERISLIIVKAIVETLQESKIPLDIIAAQDIDDARFALRGYITSYQKPNKLKQWFGKSDMQLSVEGSMLFAKTGDQMLSFSDSQICNLKKKSCEDAAHNIGQRIGRFVNMSYK